jgi:hypothetical protein
MPTLYKGGMTIRTTELNEQEMDLLITDARAHKLEMVRILTTKCYQ